jgi:hypothetical protein
MTDLNSSQSFNNSSAIEALLNQNTVNDTNVLQKLQTTSDAENQQIKSTITNADVDTTELASSKQRHSKKSTGAFLDAPPPNPSSNTTSGLSAYLAYLQMMNLMQIMQSNTSEKESIVNGSLAAEGAQFGASAAESNFTSDMNNADASKASGWASIAGGLIAIVSMGAGTLLEPAEAAEDIAQSTTKLSSGDNLAADAPAAANTSVGDDTVGGDGDEPIPTGDDDTPLPKVESPEQPELSEEDQELLDEMEKIAKSEKAGQSPTTGGTDSSDPANTNNTKTVSDSTTKENTPNKFRVNGAKFLTGIAPQALSGAATGVGQKISGSLSAAAALPKEQAAYDQVVQGLTSSVSQSTQALIGSSDKEIGTLLDLKQQSKQMNAQIAQAYSR